MKATASQGLNESRCYLGNHPIPINTYNMLLTVKNFHKQHAQKIHYHIVYTFFWFVSYIPGVANLSLTGID